MVLLTIRWTSVSPGSVPLLRRLLRARAGVWPAVRVQNRSISSVVSWKNHEPATPRPRLTGRRARVDGAMEAGGASPGRDMKGVRGWLGADVTPQVLMGNHGRFLLFQFDIFIKLGGAFPIQSEVVRMGNRWEVKDSNFNSWLVNH